MSHPSSRWHRFMFVAPILLWRLGLGPLLGRVLLVLSHRGRKSGRVYHTLIEYHELNGTIYAPSAFGTKSDWYQNIVADSRVTIQTSYGAQSMEAKRIVDDEELLRVFRLFYRRDPPITALYLKSLNIRLDEEDILQNKDKIYWLRFDPTNEETPEPLAVDLTWIWAVVAAICTVLVIMPKLSRNQKVS